MGILSLCMFIICGEGRKKEKLRTQESKGMNTRRNEVSKGKWRGLKIQDGGIIPGGEDDAFASKTREPWGRLFVGFGVRS